MPDVRPDRPGRPGDLAEMGDDGLGRLGDRVDLLVGEQVEEVAADGLDVRGGRLLDGARPVRGQDDDRGAVFAGSPSRRTKPRRCIPIATDTLTTHVPDGEPVLPGPVDDVRARARTIAVPVLAVVGGIDSDDHIRMATQVADSLPHGTTRTIGGTAHYPNLEEPDEFNEALETFLHGTA